VTLARDPTVIFQHRLWQMTDANYCAFVPFCEVHNGL
jgi:hypothetical protein